MKKLILLAFVLAGLNGYAQDFKINSEVKYSKGVISLPPNKIILNYHHVSRVNDSVWLYQPQFFTEDSLGHRLPPSDDLVKKVFTITAEQANFTPDSLMQLFYLPYLETVYPGRVVKDKSVFNKK